jgi:hypothetical protein
MMPEGGTCYTNGWNAYRAEMLRRIEEAGKEIWLAKQIYKLTNKKENEMIEACCSAYPNCTHNNAKQCPDTLPSVGFSEEKDMWKNRSRKMKCTSCMYYVRKESDSVVSMPGYEVGRCRRHSPSMNGWPVMRGGDWCGDHKLDENKC